VKQKFDVATQMFDAFAGDGGVAFRFRQDVASENSVPSTRGGESRRDCRMIAIAVLFVRVLCDCFKPRQRLEAENLVLRHQLNILPHADRIRWAGRALVIWLYRHYPRILDAVTIVRPETVVRWHRMGYAAVWQGKSRPYEPATDWQGRARPNSKNKY
jgi:hypothetical protein